MMTENEKQHFRLALGTLSKAVGDNAQQIAYLAKLVDDEPAGRIPQPGDIHPSEPSVEMIDASPLVEIVDTFIASADSERKRTRPLDTARQNYLAVYIDALLDIRNGIIQMAGGE